MKNLNIYIASSFPYYTGGIDSWLYGFLKQNEIKAKYNITVYCFKCVDCTKQPVFDISRFRHAKVVHTPEFEGFFKILSWSIKYLRFLRNSKAELAELHLSLGSIPMGFPLAIAKIIGLIKGDFICSVRGQVSKDVSELGKSFIFQKLSRFCEGFSLNRADVLISNGWDTRLFIQEYFNLESKVIPNAIEPGRIPKSVSAKTLDFFNSLDSNKYIFTHVGTLREIKGIDYILESYSKLSEEDKQHSVLVFVGKGNIDSYKEKSQKLGILNNVHFTGESNVPMEYIMCSDAVINVSGGSGVSNSLIESLALGKPVLCWDNLTFTQVIDKKNGVACKHGSVESLAQGFNIMMRTEFNPDAIRESISDYYWDEVMSLWNKVLK